MNLEELRARYEAERAADDAMPSSRARHVEAACDLIVGLVEDLEDEAAAALQATLPALVADRPSLARATHERLARELARFGAREQVRLIASDARLLAAASAVVDDPQLASEMERALARQASGDAAIAHARKSLEHAHETVEPQVIADAMSFLCELLVERGGPDALADAKALLLERPPTRDGRADRALYDEIRRQLGEHVPDPPEEADEPATLDPAVRAWLVKPVNVVRGITEGGLAAPFKLREWSSGAVASEADLDSQEIFGPVRSYWCACGRFRGREYSGLTCSGCGVELVHAKHRRVSVGHIALPAPCLHPWYAACAPALLGAPAAVIEMPAPALARALAAVDLDAAAERYKQDIITAPKARVADEAGKKLAIVDAFRHAHAAFGTRPDSLVLETILVAPPAGELASTRPLVRAAYAALLAAPGDARAVAELFAALAR